MGRDREEKGIGKLRFKTEDRQTDRQPPRLCKDHRQSPTPSSLPDSPLNWAHSLSKRQFVSHPSLRSWSGGEVRWLLFFCQRPLLRVLPEMGAQPLRWDERGPRCPRAEAVRLRPAFPIPALGSNLFGSCHLADDITSGGRYTAPLHPWGGGRDSSGTLEGQGRGK